jgi:hypothetical protein
MKSERLRTRGRFACPATRGRNKRKNAKTKQTNKQKKANATHKANSDIDGVASSQQERLIDRIAWFDSRLIERRRRRTTENTTAACQELLR